MVDPKDKQSTENPGKGDKPKELTPAQQLSIENERLEKNNAETKRLQEEQVKINAETVNAGGAEAGGPPKQEETEDEKYKREAKERYAGTGMSPVDEDEKKHGI